MANQLRKFETEVDMEVAKLSGELMRPYVALLEEAPEEDLKFEPTLVTLQFDNDEFKVIHGEGALTSDLISGFSSSVIYAKIGDDCTSIGANAFNGFTNLKSVDLNSKITSIGNYAFQNTNISEIILPNTLTEIGNGVFAGCQLTSITIPSSITSIGAGAFNGCQLQDELTIPSGVSFIGDTAFYGNSGLTQITVQRLTPATIGVGVFDETNDAKIVVECSALNDYKNATNWSAYESRFECQGTPSYLATLTLNTGEVVNIEDDGNHILTSAMTNAYSATCVSVEITDKCTSIGSSAFCADFWGFRSLSSVTIGNNVTKIGDSAFWNCSGLTSVVIPDSVTIIDDAAFGIDNSSTLLSSVTIGNSVTSIGWGAFWGCSGLTEVTIPNSVTSIGEYAFRECYSLTSLTIGNSVTSIGRDAFNRCTSLTSVTIPNSVTSIGQSAFTNCSSLSEITCLPETPPTLGSGAFDFTHDVPIYVDCSVKDDYKSAWSDYESRIQCKYNGLCRLTLKDDSVVEIAGEGELTSAMLSSYTANTVGAVIGEKCTSIGDNAFDNCTSLSSLTIPNSVTSIGDRAFGSCSGLTEVSIGNSVTSIGEGAFEDCSSLSSITLPDSLTSIGIGAFSDCTSLSSITIPNSVTSLEGVEFENCTSLSSVTIGSGVTSIGDGTFMLCTSLFSVTIPNSVTSIGVGAFSNCTSLSEITCLPETPPELGDTTVFLNTSVMGIFVPASAVSTYQTASGWSTYADRIQSIT